MDKDKKRIWLIILWIVAVVLLLRFTPKIGYGVAAITLLALLFRMGKKK